MTDPSEKSLVQVFSHFFAELEDIVRGHTWTLTSYRVGVCHKVAVEQNGLKDYHELESVLVNDDKEGGDWSVRALHDLLMEKTCIDVGAGLIDYGKYKISEDTFGSETGDFRMFWMMMFGLYFCLFAGGALNLAGTADEDGGQVSVIFRGLPSPIMFQSFFVIIFSIQLSTACGFLILPPNSNSKIKNFYVSAAVVSVVVAAAAVVLVCAYSSLAYIGKLSPDK